MVKEEGMRHSANTRCGEQSEAAVFPFQQLKVQLPLQRLYLLGNGRLRNEIFLRRLGKAVQPNNRLNVFELSQHLRVSHYDHLSFLIIAQKRKQIYC